MDDDREVAGRASRGFSGLFDDSSGSESGDGEGRGGRDLRAPCGFAFALNHFDYPRVRSIKTYRLNYPSGPSVDPRAGTNCRLITLFNLTLSILLDAAARLYCLCLSIACAHC